MNLLVSETKSVNGENFEFDIFKKNVIGLINLDSSKSFAYSKLKLEDIENLNNQSFSLCVAKFGLPIIRSAVIVGGNISKHISDKPASYAVQWMGSERRFY